MRVFVCIIGCSQISTLTMRDTREKSMLIEPTAVINLDNVEHVASNNYMVNAAIIRYRFVNYSNRNGVLD